MSICNVWTSREGGVVAVDTACARYPEGRGEFSKVLPMPHLNALLAFRGMNASALAVFLSAMNGGVRDFDDVVALAPGVFREIEHEGVPRVPEGVDLTLELFIVGWSPRLDRMALARFLYRPGEDLDYSEPDTLGSMLSPCADAEASEDGLMVPFRETDDLGRDIRALVEAQIEHGRKTNPDTITFGGRLLVAIIDRYSMRVEDLGEIG